jgi:hypothetical protein
MVHFYLFRKRFFSLRKWKEFIGGTFALQNFYMKKVYCLIIASLFITVASAQVIKGQIKNADGEAASGASVLLKNTFNSTIADKNGTFQLTVQEPGKLYFDYQLCRLRKCRTAGFSG